MKLFIFCALAVGVNVVRGERVTGNGTDLCANSGCFCQLTGESDFPYVDIDCSLNDVSLFQENFTLPEYTYLLDLSANNLTDIGSVSSVLRSSSMRRLFLNRNLLITIGAEPLNLPQLTYLDLSDNSLEILDPVVFTMMHDLQCLKLASNQFKMFAPGNFKTLSALEVLILDDNPIGQYLINTSLFQDNGLALNPGIEAISLEGTGLRDLPENFLSEAYNLRHLRLSRNQLTVIPELPFTMEYLDLSDTTIVEIDADDFSNLPALKELLLNNMDVAEIPEYTFASMKALKRLELKGNRKLRTFSSLAFGEEVLEDSDDFILEDLSLRGSFLSTLDQALLEPFSRLTKLDLQGNPWTCDCRLAWIKELQIPKEDTDHIRCFRPMSMFNSRVLEVDARALVCRSRFAEYQRTGSWLVVGLCVVLVGCALWIFLVAPRHGGRPALIQNMVSPNSPYSRITIEPNAAEDYR